MTSQFSQVLDTKRCAPRPKYRKRPNARGTRWSHCRWHHGWGFGRSREGEIRKADLSSALNLNPGSRSNPPAKLSVIEMTSKKKNIVSTSSFAREAPLYPPNQCASRDENSDSVPYINPKAPGKSLSHVELSKIRLLQRHATKYVSKYTTLRFKSNLTKFPPPAHLNQL